MITLSDEPRDLTPLDWLTYLQKEVKEAADYGAIAIRDNAIHLNREEFFKAAIENQKKVKEIEHEGMYPFEYTFDHTFEKHTVTVFCLSAIKIELTDGMK